MDEIFAAIPWTTIHIDLYHALVFLFLCGFVGDLIALQRDMQPASLAHWIMIIASLLCIPLLVIGLISAHTSLSQWHFIQVVATGSAALANAYFRFWAWYTGKEVMPLMFTVTTVAIISLIYYTDQPLVLNKSF